jgi:hypothetical protein
VAKGSPRAGGTVSKSSLGDAKSSLGDAKSSLGDAKSSRWVTLRARWVTLTCRLAAVASGLFTRGDVQRGRQQSGAERQRCVKPNAGVC